MVGISPSYGTFSGFQARFSVSLFAHRFWSARANAHLSPCCCVQAHLTGLDGRTQGRKDEDKNKHFAPEKEIDMASWTEEEVFCARNQIGKRQIPQLSLKHRKLDS